VSKAPAEIARDGLEAWRAGDFQAIEQILDPEVEWRSFDPGEWGCHNREDVMRTLRDRYEQGFAKGNLQFRDGADDAVIVVSHPREIGGPDWPEETATAMTFRDGRVVAMQDYRSEAEALAAAGRLKPDAPDCRHPSALHRLRSFLRRSHGRREVTCGDWFDELPPDSFVREPLRPRPNPPSGSVALQLPRDLA